MCGHCGCDVDTFQLERMADDSGAEADRAIRLVESAEEDAVSLNRLIAQQDTVSGQGSDITAALAGENRRLLNLHKDVLLKNNQNAEDNRALFSSFLTINLMSSPGAGKTTFIHRLLSDLGRAPKHAARSVSGESIGHSDISLRAGVIVGDLATSHDARKIRETGAPTVQITTGNLCHLEAGMVAAAAKKLDLPLLNLLIIENVGNLVCPAAYDLGEDLKFVLMSVTEGEDKPLKYPTIFKRADVVLITKCDLADAVKFDRSLALSALSNIAPQATVFEVSAQDRTGMQAVYAYLQEAMTQYLPGFKSRE